MSPRGNRTKKRGHRTPIGGPGSKGTIQRTVRLSFETNRKVEKKIAQHKKEFAEYIRGLIDEDLKR